MNNIVLGLREDEDQTQIYSAGAEAGGGALNSIHGTTVPSGCVTRIRQKKSKKSKVRETVRERDRENIVYRYT